MLDNKSLWIVNKNNKTITIKKQGSSESPLLYLQYLGHLLREKERAKRETERERKIEKRMKEHHSCNTALVGKWEHQKART